MFDDKGSRLDSIYITARDIKLGEQLESDRYYILVEEVKKAPDGNKTLVQQKGELVQPNFNGSNTFGTMKICSRQG